MTMNASWIQEREMYQEEELALPFKAEMRTGVKPGVCRRGTGNYECRMMNDE